MGNGKTAHVNIFNGSLIPFGAKTSYKPTSLKDEARLHQLGVRRRGWSSDLLIANGEDLEILSASKKYGNMFKHQEVAHEALRLPCADGSLKLFDLAPPRRGARPAGRNIEQDDKEEEEEEVTVFEEAKGEYVWSMSGDCTYRRPGPKNGPHCLRNEKKEGVANRDEEKARLQDAQKENSSRFGPKTHSSPR